MMSVSICASEHPLGYISTEAFQEAMQYASFEEKKEDCTPKKKRKPSEKRKERGKELAKESGMQKKSPKERKEAGAKGGKKSKRKPYCK